MMYHCCSSQPNPEFQVSYSRAMEEKHCSFARFERIVDRYFGSVCTKSDHSLVAFSTLRLLKASNFVNSGGIGTVSTPLKTQRGGNLFFLIAIVAHVQCLVISSRV